MAELIVIRHGQASFGAEDYDRLSDVGHAQARAVGRALKAQGLQPDLLARGSMRRHQETLEGLCQGLEIDPNTAEIDDGLNEFDFTGLLNARFADGTGPDGMHDDRKSHFRTLRETVLAWQRDEIPNPPERWSEFAGRIESARAALCASGAKQVVAISSGGPIGQLVAASLSAPVAEQIKVQLQTKNCGVTRFIFSPRAFYLHSFNETPHIDASNAAALLTYS